MGLSLRDFLGGVVSVLPVPGAGTLGTILAASDDGGSGNNLPASLVATDRGANNSPYVPDFIEGLYNPAINQASQPMTNGSCGVNVTVTPQSTTRLKAPRGYVIVECPPGSGQKTAMLKPVARALGLWKPRKKPPIKVKDWEALKRADSTIKKLKTVQKRAGMIQRARGRK